LRDPRRRNRILKNHLLLLGGKNPFSRENGEKNEKVGTAQGPHAVEETQCP
jgi:hypothetical protein